MRAVMPDESFKVGRDIADEMPEPKVDKKGRSMPIPPLSTYMEPTTWATELKPNRHGKPTAFLRREFLEEWNYIVEADSFVHVARPGKLWTSDDFDNLTRIAVGRGQDIGTGQGGGRRHKSRGRPLQAGPPERRLHRRARARLQHPLPVWHQAGRGRSPAVNRVHGAPHRG